MSTSFEQGPPQARRIVVIGQDMLRYLAVKEIVYDLSRSIELMGFQNPKTAQRVLSGERMDIVIADAQTDDPDGLDYIPPLIESRVARRVVILSSRRDERSLAVLRKQRFDAWIDTGSVTIDELVRCLSDTELKPRFISSSISNELKRLTSPRTNQLLSDREQAVFSLLGSGMDNHGAARRLGISPETIRSHRARIMHKLNCHDKGQLIHLALQRGYVRVTANTTLFPGFGLE